LPSTRSARKARPAEQAERHQDKACQGRELELDQGDEELDRQDEERDQDDEPGDQQDEDLNEVLEERDVAQKLAGGLEDRPPGVDADLGEPARLEELVGRETRSGSLEAEARKGVEEDLGEAVEIADQEREEANTESLFDEVGKHVLIGAPGPEQACKRHIDDDQGGRQKHDLAAEQAEAGIYVAGEDLGEPIDDAGIHLFAH